MTDSPDPARSVGGPQATVRPVGDGRYRMPEPGEPRAVCWDHGTCDGESCACTCHAPRLFPHLPDAPGGEP